jgi:hypothetical protein
LYANPCRTILPESCDDPPLSIDVDPPKSECDDLVEELLRDGYLQTYPIPTLSAHGLYRLSERGIGSAEES